MSAVASNGRNGNVLTSWKEIAAYLDRDVRTCVRWEKRYGLPVHRLEKDAKAKVFAYRDEIDRWLAERPSGGGAGPGGRGRPRSVGRAVPLLFALAGLAAAAYFLFLRPAPDPGASVPADFRVRGSALVAVDAKGRELWAHDTGLAGLESEAFYREHFQAKRPGQSYVPVWPYLMIRDLDGAAGPEVLFSPQTKLEDGDGALLCLDGRGNERWRFEAGRELETGERTFRKEFRIFGFDVDDYDGDGAPEILVIAFHKPHWPCQVALLDTAGRLEGEYWNAGYVMDASAGDVDGDGDRELVLAGVNNEYNRGCVAVFEAGALRGASPQRAAEFAMPGPGPGGQSAYILFPKSDVHAAMHLQGDPVNYFWIHEGGGLTAQTYETQIHFDLDRALSCRDVTLSHFFLNLHGEFAGAGKVRSVPDDRYRRALGEALLYYEGGEWVGRPCAGAKARPAGPAGR